MRCDFLRRAARARSALASASRWRCSIVCAAASSFVACRSKSARVPLRCFDALLGSFTPSMANISRPIRPWASQIGSTAANTWAIVVAQLADEVRDRREVRARVAAQRDEGDVLAAGALDAAAADDAVRVGEQHDLEQHRRRVGAGAGLVVPKARIEGRQIDLVIEQVVQRVLERAGEQLAREIDRQKPRIGVDVLVAGHRGAPVIAMQLPCNTCASSADCEDGFSTASLERRQYSSPLI